MTLLGLGPAGLALMGGVALVGGFIRGYSGFGYASMAMTAAGLLVDPRPFAPVILICEIVVALQMGWGARRDIDWRRVAGLFAGAAIGVPAGVAFLSSIGVEAVRITLSLYILAVSAVLWSGWRIRGRPGDAMHALAGFVSGFANGAAVGGPPTAAFLSAQEIAPAAFRATIVGFFLLLDVWAIPFMGGAGLIGWQTLIMAAGTLPLLLLGVWLGSRRFLSADPQNFRRFAILLLAALAVLGLARSLT